LLQLRSADEHLAAELALGLAVRGLEAARADDLPPLVAVPVIETRNRDCAVAALAVAAQADVVPIVVAITAARVANDVVAHEVSDAI
jgi:hypothetical protein